MPKAERLEVSLPELGAEAFGTYRLYDADGREVFAQTGAGKTNTPFTFTVPVPAAQRGRPWFYRRSKSQSGTPDIQIGGMVPVWSCAKETFFVPEKFR